MFRKYSLFASLFFGFHWFALSVYGDVKATPMRVDFIATPKIVVLNQTVILENTGDALYRVASVLTTDPSFEIDGPNQINRDLPKKKNIPIKMKFTPQADGPIQADLLVNVIEDPEGPNRKLIVLPIPLLGYKGDTIVSISPEELKFQPTDYTGGEVSNSKSLELKNLTPFPVTYSLKEDTIFGIEGILKTSAGITGTILGEETKTLQIYVNYRAFEQIYKQNGKIDVTDRMQIWMNQTYVTQIGLSANLYQPAKEGGTSNQDNVPPGASSGNPSEMDKNVARMSGGGFGCQISSGASDGSSVILSILALLLIGAFSLGKAAYSPSH